MKNRLNYKWILAGCLAVMSVSCDDWTELESLATKTENIMEQEPEVYQKYLENLRSYRFSDHKTVIAGFDNQSSQGKRIYHLTQLPDSIDIVSLDNPEVMPDWLQKELTYCREQKGMKFIYEIDFSVIEQQYKDLENSSDEEIPEFETFASNYVARMLNLCDEKGYDGVTIRYAGYSKDYMLPADKEEYVARQKAFLNPILAWCNQHTDKLLLFRGTPHFLEDEYLQDGSLLTKSKFIIIETSLSLSAVEIEYRMAGILERREVPTDRFIVQASVYSLDETDVTTGYFWDKNGNSVSAVVGCAVWVDEYNSAYQKAGLAILNTQNDYYNSAKIFPNVREAISIMNPSIKK